MLGDDWFDFLQPFLKSGLFKTLEEKLLLEIKRENSILVPSLSYVFEPFKNCPLKELKVVILNDTPFKDLKANDGLAFSVSNTDIGIMDIPLEAECFWEGVELDVCDGFHLQKDYDHHKLANQGVLLLNCSPTLSYIDNKLDTPFWESHYDLWKSFIKYVIYTICKNYTGIIFVTLGSKPREYISPVIKSNNYLLTSTHPRSVSNSSKTWDSGGVFSTINKILKQNNNLELNWLN